MKIDKVYYTYDIIDVTWHSPEELIEEIQNAWNKYGKDNVSFDVECRYEYGDPEVYAELKCKRNMTDEEKNKRIKDDEANQARRDNWERDQYLALKKKFEGK